MAQKRGNTLFDSTPRASLDCSDEADQAGSCFPSLKTSLPNGFHTKPHIDKSSNPVSDEAIYMQVKSRQKAKR